MGSSRFRIVGQIYHDNTAMSWPSWNVTVVGAFTGIGRNGNVEFIGHTAAVCSVNERRDFPRRPHFHDRLHNVRCRIFRILL